MNDPERLHQQARHIGHQTGGAGNAEQGAAAASQYRSAPADLQGLLIAAFQCAIAQLVQCVDTGLLQLRVPAGTPALAVSEVLVSSHDGVQVPLAIVHRADLPRGRPHPTLLVGYGAYGMSFEASFNVRRLAWLERGGVLAYANVRGSGAFGDAWHRAGFKATKPNTWKDFIACGQGLIAQKWTSPDYPNDVFFLTTFLLDPRFTDFTLLNAVEELATDAAVAAHEADGDLQVLCLGLFAQGEHPASGRTVHGDRLLQPFLCRESRYLQPWPSLLRRNPLDPTHRPLAAATLARLAQSLKIEALETTLSLSGSPKRVQSKSPRSEIGQTPPISHRVC